jgi:molybdate transport system substrate-binding protein
MMADKFISLLSGGAAHGLVSKIQERFAREHGSEVRGTFGAVGAMRDKLLGGEACDVVILSQALIDELMRDGHVAQGSAVPLGIAKTGVAVKSGRPRPDVSTAAALKAALLAASGIYLPDPVKATAGIHFIKVLKSLGIADEVESRLRPFPNGAAAMGAMAQASESDVIGCTQVTEILFAPGVDLVGLLPGEFELGTIYTAAVCAKSADQELAARFIELLADPQAQSLRTSAGFEPVST